MMQGTLIDKIFRSSLVSMTAAVVVTMLGVVIDGVVIGRFLGPECMAAYTLATPVTNLVMALSGLMTEGTQVLCALNLGKGDAGRARNVFSVCMVATLAVSAVIVCGVLFFTSGITMFLGAHGTFSSRSWAATSRNTASPPKRTSSWRSA